MKPALLTIDHLYKRFNVAQGLFPKFSFKKARFVAQQAQVSAINGVSLEIGTGEVLCVVGESGSGKSTLARIVMGLLRPSSGTIKYCQQRIDHLSARQWMPYRKHMQMIFQNPYASLNPRMTVRQTLSEAIRFHFPALSRAEVNDKVVSTMLSVGMQPDWASRYPHEFSGGQKQRISIARALAVDPVLLVADEPVSALDVSVQAQILNLMMETREQHALTYLFITHDLSVVKHFGTRVVVMYLGSFCEIAPTKTLFSHPQHPYTRALISAIPTLTPHQTKPIPLFGEIPSALKLPAGCVFNRRCSYANQRCQSEKPELKPVGDHIYVACHGVEENRI